MTVELDYAQATRRLYEARQELLRIRRERGRGSSQGLEAFQRLNALSHELGMPLNGLRRDSRNEHERFFARTLPGPDGHVYWTGGSRGFTTNDGRWKYPRRWWFELVSGRALDRYEEFTNICGDAACITPDHHTVAQRTRQMFTDQQIVGALQVEAMRIGRPPSLKMWAASRRKPSGAAIRLRFGSWELAMRAAGFTEYVSPRVWTADECLEALRFAHDQLGHWPSLSEYAALGPVLGSNGLPRSITTVKEYLGPWPEAIRKAMGA